MIKRKIGIAGIGFVGGALKAYFEKNPDYEVFVYDKGKSIGSPGELERADFIYLCLPTPYKEGIGCDTGIIEEVLSQIKGEKVIIIKSTQTPGATERLQKKFSQHKLLCNPEFLNEIVAERDMLFPDRQIIGYTEKSYNVAKEVLAQLPLAPFEKIVPATVAEVIKYFGNNWFAVKVSFANQMYDLCQKLGIDYDLVMEGAGADRRVGRSHLKVWHKGYRGYGGKCLPKDLKAMISLMKKYGIEAPVLESTDRYNDELVKKQGLDPLDTNKSPKVKKETDTEWMDGGDTLKKGL